MSEFIIIGIVLMLGVNGLYSRFCEKAKECVHERLNFLLEQSSHNQLAFTTDVIFHY